jgi:23S rRNA (cytidine1920-2'-O)/16S rRNA (cytidine1409-2'-O)-methyltransferase
VTALAESRLDSFLAQHGLARSRNHAARLIADGLVTVDGVPVLKASARVGEGAVVIVAAADHYVSRAAHKLNAALDAFDIPVEGTLALDVGASTGGFSQVLLERGAGLVIALDVGHDQLAESIRASDRLIVIEGFNARALTAPMLAKASGVAEHPRLVVADLSFISLPIILPALVDTAGLEADYVLLVKPQFEVGRQGIREGIVHDADLRADAVSGVMWAGWDLGLGTAGFIPSPIVGKGGNREYLVWLSARVGSNPTEWREQVTAAS